MCLRPSLVRMVTVGKRRTPIRTKVASTSKIATIALMTMIPQAWMTPITTCGHAREVSTKVKLEKTIIGMRAKEARIHRTITKTMISHL